MSEVTTPLQKEFGLIHIKDLANMFNVAERTLRDWWVKNKKFPKPVVVSGDCVLYSRADILLWVAEIEPK